MMKVRTVSDLRFLYLLLPLTLAVAVFLNLGLLPLQADEPTRAAVSLEMLLRGKYITSTLSGEMYYNKPPLYNWILAGLFRLTGNYSEFMVRLPALLSLIGYSITLFMLIRKHTNMFIAFITAIAFATGSRMLFYESMLGHIDLLYSWLTFLNFYAIFYFSRREKYLQLFLVTYLITTAGFLMKGMPSLLFQGISLLTWFWFSGKIKKLFSIQHLAGISVFVFCIGLYLYLYNLEHPVKNLLGQLWTESSKRSMTEKSWTDTLLHLLTFPLSFMADLFPWSLMVIACFRRDFMSIIRSNHFLYFCFLVLVSNSMVYWLSPDTLPRYLLMLYPLWLCISAYFFFIAIRQKKESASWLSAIFTGLTVAGGTVFVAAFFYPGAADMIPGFYLVNSVLVVLAFVICYLVVLEKLPGAKALWLTGMLVLLRFAFSLMVLPHREAEGNIGHYKADALKVASLSKGHPLKIMNYTPLNHDIVFYITRERMQVLDIERHEAKAGTWYLSTDYYLDKRKHTKYYRFITAYKNTPVNLVTFE